MDVETPDIHLFYSSNVACLYSVLFQSAYQISLSRVATRLSVTTDLIKGLIVL